jgi:hypothetical protein
LTGFLGHAGSSSWPPAWARPPHHVVGHGQRSPSE